jgi:hypothetical protein
MEFKMKKYNKPVVEINSFEVEDIITVSVAFGGDSELQAVYKDFVGGAVDDDDQGIVIDW